MLLTGQKVGHIRVERVIGHGGMGAVYEGFDEKLARRVALKVIHTDRLGGAGRRRILREAQALSQLDHPNICHIYDCIEDRDGDVLVLELIEGRTLSLAIREPLPPGEKLRIARAIADVLVMAHRAGIIHRDLKPENVMLTSGGEVKVLDFGLARFENEIDNAEAGDAAGKFIGTPTDLSEGDHGDGTATDILPLRKGVARTAAGTETALGIAIGTPVYMSPEQARGESLTPASDLYSFGLLLQVLFSGQAPYAAGSTTHEIIARAARGESAAPDGLPRDVRSLVQRLKSLAPSDRPTAVEAARRLRLIAEKPKRIVQRGVAAAIAIGAIAGTWKYTVDLRRERAAAVIAENDARLRRADADGLIGFMLGDLRKKLEPVGKLDILDDVAARSLRVLSSIDRARMTPEELLRTATALDQVGEVRMAQGKLNDATLAFERARVIAEEAARRAPNDGDAQLAYATSRFWLGNALRLRGDLNAALAHMTVYRDVAVKLAARFPQNDKYKLESAYGYSTVGTILEAQGQLEQALSDYETARRIKAARASAVPEDLDRQGDLAVTLDKIGTLLLRLGDLQRARETFESERALLTRLTATQPDNITFQRRLATSYSYLSQTWENAGEIDRAWVLAQEQATIFSAILGRDPTNSDRSRDLAVTHAKLGRLLRFQQHYDQSLAELRSAMLILTPLVLREPGRKDWHRDLGQIELAEGRTLLALHNLRDAAAAASAAESQFRNGPADAITRRGLSEAFLLKGDAMENQAGAATAWTTAAQLVRADATTTADPVILATYAGALTRLGRTAEAGPILDRLQKMGFRHPDLTLLPTNHQAA